MSAGPTIFGAASRTRTARAVRYVEQLIAETGTPEGGDRQRPLMVRCVVNGPADGVGKYEISLLKAPTADIDPAVDLASAQVGSAHTPTSGTTYIGINPIETDIDGHVLPTGLLCMGMIHRQQTDGQIVVILIAAPDGQAFHVLLTQAGGSAGSASTDCNWTYNVHPVGDATITLASGLAPRRRRFELIEYANGGTDAGANEGIAAFNGTAIVLLDVLTEIPVLGPCGGGS